MQKVTDEDMQVLGEDQATPIFWQADKSDKAEVGVLSLEHSTGELATLRQFDAADYIAGSVFESLEPGLIVQLAEGFFVLDDADFPAS
ncbi:MAG: hypothetical protein H7Y22_11860 [Gemmatimonadaceae bacterium]|nr:hypothetical protein [Gloeobacterales cyanobacterium ES-bin-141]